MAEVLSNPFANIKNSYISFMKRYIDYMFPLNQTWMLIHESRIKHSLAAVQNIKALIACEKIL